MTQRIFDSQQKRKLVDKFIQYTDKYKVSVSSSGTNSLTLKLQNTNFKIQTKPNYTRQERQLLNRG